MKVYVEANLKEFIAAKIKKLKAEGSEKNRFCIKDLKAFIETDDNKICGIFGLRRTGKSTLMFQAIASMNCQVGALEFSIFSVWERC